jgi:hypothetical protein
LLRNRLRHIFPQQIDHRYSMWEPLRAESMAGQGKIVAVHKMGFLPGKEFLPSFVNEIARNVGPFRSGVFPGDTPLGFKLGPLRDPGGDTSRSLTVLSLH